MASLHTYTWGSTDTLWHVVGRYLQSAGYPDASTFADAIRAANPAIRDWAAVPPGTTIIIPYSTS